jgi:hypothetical protein
LPHLPAFVPLVHELVYYLAGARSAEFNLEPGQPLLYRMDAGASLDGFTLQPPGSEAKPLSTEAADRDPFAALVERRPHGPVLRHDGMREPGVYRLRTPENSMVYYVVRPRRADESDLSPATEDDNKEVAKRLPEDMVRYLSDRAELLAQWQTETQLQEIWWWLLLGLVGLLCAEIWMTRRIVLNRTSA